MSEQVLEHILTELTAINSKLDGVSEQVAGNSEQIVGNSKQILSNSEQIAGNSKLILSNAEQIEGNSEQILRNSEHLRELINEQQQIKQAIVEIDHVVKRIEVRQEHHELTLDLLSRRSIDQEAELRRIK